MVRVISIDTATKSLAISIINYNLDFLSDIEIAYNTYKKYKAICISALKPNDILHNSNLINELINAYNNLLDTVLKILNLRIDIEFMTVVDLIPGEKVTDTNIIYRTTKLHNYLNNILDPLIAKYDLPNHNFLFLLEYQMGPNVKSNAISTQIMYHLTKYTSPNTNIRLVGPSLKNKIVIGGQESNYSNFVEKYKTLYAANKNHSKFNLIKLLQYLKKEKSIKHIKSKNIDDIADSVIMSLAYILKHYWS